EEVLHLRGHHPEPRRNPEDEAVIVGQLSRRGKRSVLFELVICLARHIFGHELSDALEGYLGAPLPRALHRRLGHLLHVTEAGIINNKYLSHNSSAERKIIRNAKD